jgi:anti-anti-sigma factor
LSSAPDLSDLFESLIRTNELVVVDLSEAQFVDSSVLRHLFTAYELADASGKVFRLQLGTRAIVERVLEISGILETIPCVPTRAEALRIAE